MARISSLIERHEEFVHGAHDVGMRIERAARETHVRGPVLPEALHEVLASAEHAHGQPAAQRLAVGDHVGAHAEVFLRAARSQAESHEHLVEDQHDAAFGADGAQFQQPFDDTPSRSKCALRPLSSSIESLGALEFGCMACSGLTSTQAMSRRLRSTRSDASLMSASV